MLRVALLRTALRVGDRSRGDAQPLGSPLALQSAPGARRSGDYDGIANRRGSL